MHKSPVSACDAGRRTRSLRIIFGRHIGEDPGMWDNRWTCGICEVVPSEVHYNIRWVKFEDSESSTHCGTSTGNSKSRLVEWQDVAFGSINERGILSKEKRWRGASGSNAVPCVGKMNFRRNVSSEFSVYVCEGNRDERITELLWCCQWMLVVPWRIVVCICNEGERGKFCSTLYYRYPMKRTGSESLKLIQFSYLTF